MTRCDEIRVLMRTFIPLMLANDPNVFTEFLNNMSKEKLKTHISAELDNQISELEELRAKVKAW